MDVSIVQAALLIVAFWIEIWRGESTMVISWSSHMGEILDTPEFQVLHGPTEYLVLSEKHSGSVILKTNKTY